MTTKKATKATKADIDALTSTPKNEIAYKPLGDSGITVSELCLGAATFAKTEEKLTLGFVPCVDEKGSYKFLDDFYANGGNFIDTSDTYGDSEGIIGRWIKKRSEKDPKFRLSIVLATKVFFKPIGQGPNRIGLGRAHIIAACDSSLEDLQTDYIDLYQVHAADHTVSVRCVMETIKLLIQRGKILHWGISNWSASMIMETMWLADKYNLPKPICLQHSYSLLTRDVEWEILPLAKRFNIGFIPWGPLQGGWLTGKIKKSVMPPKDCRVGASEGVWPHTGYTHFAKDSTWKLLDEIKAVAQEVKRSMAAVSLRWLMQKPGVTGPIIGVRKPQHFQDAMTVTEFSLSKEQMERLDKASQPKSIPYPYFFPSRT
ncbi:hypothetical protein AAMO2058_001704700 [Amorphochlora amoebiformis]